MSDLDSILNGEETKVEQVEEVEETETSEPEAEESNAEEPETEKDKTEETTTSEDKGVEQAWTKAMALDERHKRQEFEKQTQELQKQIEDLKASKEKVEIPDVFEDQEGFANALKQQYQQELSNQKVEMSRQLMMTMHDDYEAMESAFIEAAKETPVLRDQAAKSEFPAKFVYEQAKKIKDFKDMQDIDSYKAKLKAEILEEMKSETQKAVEDKTAKGENLSPSLAKVRANGKEKPVDQSLEALLGR